MTALDLSPIEQPAVRRALVGTAEDLEFLAVRRGPGREATELREEVTLLRGVVERLAGDQSPAPSRALARDLLRGRTDDELHDLIGAAEELIDARHLEAQRDHSAGRNVAARYTGRRQS